MIRSIVKLSLSMVLLISLGGASAQDFDRNVAGKLTSNSKPQVRVLTEQERKASTNVLNMNLDMNPDQVECRKVKVGRDSASKVKVTKCKSRAEFRAEAEQRESLFGESKIELYGGKEARYLNTYQPTEYIQTGGVKK